MSNARISFVYNSDIRNNGTATLAYNSVRHQLGWGDKVDRWRPEGELPEKELYIYVDDGRDDLTWECPSPSAYWAVDTHLGYDYRLWKAKQFDKVYCAQKEGVAKMRKDGVKEVYWLPLACNPMAHPNLSEMLVHKNKDDHTWGKGLDKQYDISFVGFLNEGDGTDASNNRIEWLDHAFKHFPNSWLAWQCFFEDMAVRIIRGRFGFNISIRNDLNMRFFEILSTGTCLLTNTNVEGIDDLGFEDEQHFVGYKSKEELVAKAKYYLDNPMEREKIAQAGHEKVRTGHTYHKRMQRILDDFEIAA